MVSLTDCITQDLLDVITNDDMWCCESMTHDCPLCDEEIIGGGTFDHFHIFKEKDDKMYSICVHYTCGVKEIYVDFFIDEHIDIYVEE